VVVEPRPVAQLGLARVLRAAGTERVVVCGSLAEVPTEPTRPEVVLVSLGGGTQALRTDVQRLRDTVPQLRFLGVGTDSASGGDVFEVLPVLDGVVAHPSTERVQTALRSILDGQHYFEGAVPAPVWRRMASASVPAWLSQCDLLVLQLLGDGLTDSEVAARLGCSVPRAKACVRAVLRKTGTRNRAHAVAKALREGWIE
jgi:DNA-binding NarL/FixJ family response regulator